MNLFIKNKFVIEIDTHISFLNKKNILCKTAHIKKIINKYFLFIKINLIYIKYKTITNKSC